MHKGKTSSFVKFILIITLISTGVFASDISSNSAKASSAKKEVTTKNVRGSMKGVTLRVGTSGVFAPFSYYDASGKKLIGYDIDLLNKLQNILGYKIKNNIQVEDYAPLITSISEKKLDVVAAALCATSERKKVMSFSNTYFQSGLMVMINKTKKTGITSVHTLKGKIVAVEKGTASHTYASKHLTSSTIQPYDKISGALEALKQGKVDAVIQDGPNCSYYFRVHKKSNLKAVGKEFDKSQSPYAIGLTKNSKYKKNFNAALKILKNNGTLNKLDKKWTE